MATHTKNKGIVEIMTRLYEEIRALEVEFGLLVGNGDFRPRVEYFHDAVRAYTQNHARDREPGGRLSVEYLAYDVSAIRYVQGTPLAPLSPHHRTQSASTKVATRELGMPTKKPDRAGKLQLGTLYQQYGVLFAALFKQDADDNMRDRVEEMDEQVEALASVLAALEGLGQGKGSETGVESKLLDVADQEVVAVVEALLAQKKYKNKATLAGALKGIKSKIDQTDRNIASVESAHMNYVTAQLGLYEQGKDIVKQLAAKGMNLAGNFVQNAMAQASRERGR